MFMIYVYVVYVYDVVYVAINVALYRRFLDHCTFLGKRKTYLTLYQRFCISMKRANLHHLSFHIS